MQKYMYGKLYFTFDILKEGLSELTAFPFSSME